MAKEGEGTEKFIERINQEMMGADSYDLCRPIEIDGKFHVVGVSSFPAKGTVQITHHTTTDMKDNGDFKSLTIDHRFLVDLINSLTMSKNKKWQQNPNPQPSKK